MHYQQITHLIFILAQAFPTNPGSCQEPIRKQLKHSHKPKKGSSATIHNTLKIKQQTP
jgi:hypothetical protein